LPKPRGYFFDNSAQDDANAFHRVLGDPLGMQFSDGVKSKEQMSAWISCWVDEFYGSLRFASGRSLRSRRSRRLAIAASPGLPADPTFFPLQPNWFAIKTGYTISMTGDAVFARLRRRPFVPFRLILSIGTSYDILHPEMLFVSKSGLTVAIYDRNQHPSPDELPMREALVSYLHVAATEDIPQPQMKAG
jgi:hypothetical protein